MILPGQSPADLVLSPTGLRFQGRRYPCTIGRSGITRDKHEGDGATPAGLHRIMGALFRPDRLPRTAVPAWAEPILPGDLWSDDSRDAAYNQHVRAPYAFSHEAMRRADPLYDLVLVTDWNWPEARPGKGSAIFLHTWRRRVAPTAGCIAFARRDLLQIAGAIIPGQTRLIVPYF